MSKEVKPCNQQCAGCRYYYLIHSGDPQRFPSKYSFRRDFALMSIAVTRSTQNFKMNLEWARNYLKDKKRGFYIGVYSDALVFIRDHCRLVGTYPRDAISDPFAVDNLTDARELLRLIVRDMRRGHEDRDRGGA